MEVESTMPDVKCSVADCLYWAKGNKCSAESILIDIDHHASDDYGAEFAIDPIAGDQQDQAGSVASTCCNTYKNRKHSQ